MADEVIATTVTFLLEKAIAMAADRIGLMLYFHDELNEMEGLAKDIQALLADAETKQSQNPLVLSWLRKVEDAALEAEIVLDELLYESLRRKVHEAKRGGAAKVCSFFSLFKHDISFRVRMSSRVRAINSKLKEVNHEALGIELVRSELLRRDTDVTVKAANRQTDSLPEQFVAGRIREESQIVDKLLLVSSDDSNPLVSVLPIYGMGGLGKTTLAKSIYNDEKIVNHFRKRCWICVSDKFEVTGFLKGILESLKGGRVEISSRDDIVRGIQKELSGERFLFVFDDVWNEDSGLWGSFFDSMVGLNSAIGSWCVVTTRLETVANLVFTSTTSPFKLGKLSPDDCWFIIGRKATKGEEMPAEFEMYKEEILKKCQGLPLAANVIGGLLSLQRREDWISIVANKILKVSEIVEDKITPILKLSYDFLPYPRIKKCFAYCSIYSKDRIMKGQELIRLWMAEGYLQDDMQGRTTMEEDGVECLKLLVQSSLLEKRDNDNSGDSYQMHDLVHDLAESISKRKQYDGNRSRHLVLRETLLKGYWNENSMLIRAMEVHVSDEILLKYRHARVIDLWNANIKTLPNAIGKLKHMRCLTLSRSNIKRLPESLCKLYNLQTLNLSECHRLECLPQELMNLISLRHLHFFTGREFKMPPNMGRLTRLQTLEFFNVWKENGLEIKELGFMENLKGSLSIRNLDFVKGKEEASLAKLNAKKDMIELEFRWGLYTTRRNGNHFYGVEEVLEGPCFAVEVLEGLEPCSTLERLKIQVFKGVRFPKWLGKLSALEALDLTHCMNITELGCSGDGGFPKLKTLNIWWCPQLTSAPTSFPVLTKLLVGNIKASAATDIISTTTNSLEDLRLSGVSGMRSLSDVTESSLSSCLKKLSIDDCEVLTEIPSSTLACCKCLESLEVEGCPELVSFPLNLQQQTPSLSTITLTGCPKLFSTDGIPPTGFQHLTNLTTLRIGQHDNYDWDGLKTLRCLTISGSSRTELPQQLQHFSLLVELGIWNFDSLERLPGWLAKLTSLQKLDLWICPKLEHLPTDAIRSLTNLKELRILRCPLLRETQGDEINALPNLQVWWP